MVVLAALATALIAAPAGYGWSWPTDGAVLRPFVFGVDPYAADLHRGVDIAGVPGGAVHAPAGGTVSFAGTIPGGGRTVAIRTTDGYSVTLVHLGSVSVARGAVVAEREVVGAVGASGTAEVDEPYVHLGVRIAAEEEGYVDPLGLLPPREQEPAVAVNVQPAVSPPAAPQPQGGAPAAAVADVDDATAASEPARDAVAPGADRGRGETAEAESVVPAELAGGAEEPDGRIAGASGLAAGEAAPVEASSALDSGELALAGSSPTVAPGADLAPAAAPTTLPTSRTEGEPTAPTADAGGGERSATRPKAEVAVGPSGVQEVGGPAATATKSDPPAVAPETWPDPVTTAGTAGSGVGEAAPGSVAGTATPEEGSQGRGVTVGSADAPPPSLDAAEGSPSDPVPDAVGARRMPPIGPAPAPSAEGATFPAANRSARDSADAAAVEHGRQPSEDRADVQGWRDEGAIARPHAPRHELFLAPGGRTGGFGRGKQSPRVHRSRPGAAPAAFQAKPPPALPGDVEAGRPVGQATAGRRQDLVVALALLVSALVALGAGVAGRRFGGGRGERGKHEVSLPPDATVRVERQEPSGERRSDGLLAALDRRRATRCRHRHSARSACHRRSRPAPSCRPGGATLRHRVGVTVGRRGRRTRAAAATRV
jgi:hypothetical protein